MGDKKKEAFRKKAKKMIEEIKKEFGLKVYTKLTIKTKTRKACHGYVDIHGIAITGHILLNSVLQDFSDEILEKVIRYAVYMLAGDLEDKCSNITGITVGAINFPDAEIKSVSSLALPEEFKYCIDITEQEYLRIVNEFNVVLKQINEELKNASTL